MDRVTAFLPNLLVLLGIFALFAPVAPRPWGVRLHGRVLRRERLSLLGRLRMWGLPVAGLAASALAGWWLGWVSGWILDAALVAGIVALLLPVRYVLTAEGIRVGLAPLRRWTEFGGVARRRWGVTLQGVGGRPGMTVWLSGSHGDDEFVRQLRQAVRSAYQGRPASGNTPAEPSAQAAPRAFRPAS